MSVLTGAMIIGWIELGLSIGFTLYGKFGAHFGNQIVVSVSFDVGLVATAILMLVGLYKKNECLILPHLIVQCIGLIIWSVFALMCILGMSIGGAAFKGFISPNAESDEMDAQKFVGEFFLVNYGIFLGICLLQIGLTAWFFVVCKKAFSLLKESKYSSHMVHEPVVHVQNVYTTYQQPPPLYCPQPVVTCVQTPPPVYQTHTHQPCSPQVYATANTVPQLNGGMAYTQFS